MKSGERADHSCRICRWEAGEEAGRAKIGSSWIFLSGTVQRTGSDRTKCMGSLSGADHMRTWQSPVVCNSVCDGDSLYSAGE